MARVLTSTSFPVFHNPPFLSFTIWFLGYKVLYLKATNNLNFAFPSIQSYCKSRERERSAIFLSIFLYFDSCNSQAMKSQMQALLPLLLAMKFPPPFQSSGQNSARSRPCLRSTAFGIRVMFVSLKDSMVITPRDNRDDGWKEQPMI